MRCRGSRPLVDVLAVIAMVAVSMGEAFGSGRSWSSDGPFGGAILCLSVDASDSLTIYAGTPLGLFRSRDGGASWSAVSNQIPAVSVNVIAIDPSDSQRIYIGLSVYNGILRTTDGGATWTHASSGLESSGSISAIAVDPSDPSHVYAGSGDDGGYFYSSADGGATWTAETNILFGMFRALIVNPQSPRTIYAGTYDGTWKSTDAGTTWTKFENAIASAWSLAIDFRNGPTLYVGDTLFRGVMKSMDDGATWTYVDTGLPTHILGLCNACYLPVTAVALDPSNPQHVLAGLYGDGLYETTDGGSHWVPRQSGLSADEAVSALAFSPPSHPALFIGTAHQGVLRSSPTVNAAVETNQGLANASVWRVAVDAAQSNIVFAATNDGVFRSDDGGFSWGLSLRLLSTSAFPGVWTDPVHSGVAYAAAADGRLSRTEDSGAHWLEVVPPGAFLYIPDLAFDPFHPSRLLGVTSPLVDEPATVIRSSNGGQTWSAIKISDSVVGLGWIRFDPTRPDVVYALQEGGGSMWRSTDGGSSWEMLPSSDSAGGYCQGFYRALAISPSGTLVGSYDPQWICESTDGAASFHLVGGVGIDGTPTTLLADPKSAGVYYGSFTDNVVSCCENAHVIVSRDFGRTWTVADHGTKFPPIGDLVSGGGVLYAATQGAGVFTISSNGGVIGVEIVPTLPQPPARVRR